MAAQPTAKNGKVLIPGGCWDDPELIVEYTPGQARHLATQIWKAASKAEMQQTAAALHQASEETQLQTLRGSFPEDDHFGRALLDFDGNPHLTVMGVPMSREQRIDAAAARVQMRNIFNGFLDSMGQMSDVLGPAMPTSSPQPSTPGLP